MMGGSRIWIQSRLIEASASGHVSAFCLGEPTLHPLRSAGLSPAPPRRGPVVGEQSRTTHFGPKELLRNGPEVKHISAPCCLPVGQ